MKHSNSLRHRQTRYGNPYLYVFMAAMAFAYPVHAGTITVTSTADNGLNTLRQAIVDANDSPGDDIINFSNTVFPARIRLQTVLPSITGSNTTIDGTDKGVTIDGSEISETDPTDEHGLQVRAANTTITGLSFVEFSGDSIRVVPMGSGKTLSNVLIHNNHFDNHVVVGPGEGSDAIFVTGGAGGVGTDRNTVVATISDNVIMRTTDDGIVVRGSFRGATNGNNRVTVTIDGNTINHAAEGQTNVGLTGDGIRVVSGCGFSGNALDGLDSPLHLHNEVIAYITNNKTYESPDQGILVKGGGCGDGTSHHNTVHAEILNNTVRASGLARIIHE